MNIDKTQRATDGPWQWTNFCKPDGEPISSVADVAETIAGSALHSERAELWGVTLDDAKDSLDGRATVVCYTGNGPNAHNNARVIAGVPILIDFLRRLVSRDHGFVYSRDEKDALAILGYIDGHNEAPPAAAAVEGPNGAEAARALKQEACYHHFIYEAEHARFKCRDCELVVSKPDIFTFRSLKGWVITPEEPSFLYEPVPEFAKDWPNRADTLKHTQLPFYCINCQRKAPTTYVTPNFGPFCADCMKELEGRLK